MIIAYTFHFVNTFIFTKFLRNDYISKNYQVRWIELYAFLFFQYLTSNTIY